VPPWRGGRLENPYPYGSDSQADSGEALLPPEVIEGTENTVKIFISYATKDFDAFKIPEIASWLQTQEEIENVFYWERDNTMQQSILSYMETKVSESDAVVVIATTASSQSRPVNLELEMAIMQNKKIVPVFSDINSVRLSLRTMRGIHYNDSDFLTFLVNLYRVLTGREPKKTKIANIEPETPSIETELNWLPDLQPKIEAIEPEAVPELTPSNDALQYLDALFAYGKLLPKIDVVLQRIKEALIQMEDKKFQQQWDTDDNFHLAWQSRFDALKVIGAEYKVEKQDLERELERKNVIDDPINERRRVAMQIEELKHEKNVNKNTLQTLNNEYTERLNELDNQIQSWVYHIQSKIATIEKSIKDEEILTIVTKEKMKKGIISKDEGEEEINRISAQMASSKADILVLKNIIKKNLAVPKD
jgi:hypothetical protein